MHTRRRVIRLGTAAAAALSWPHRPARAAEPIRVGWLSSLTGPLSAAAIAENKGVELAVADVNKAGGIAGRPVELLTRDTTGDPTRAVTLAQQLAFSDKVGFVIGPVNSGESLATIPILARAKMPNLVIGAVDELTSPTKYPLAFRVINTNTQWIRTANDYAIKVLRASRVAVIGDTTGYGTASAHQAGALLEKAGVKPVFTTLIDPNKVDLTDDLAKARAANADVLMPWSAAVGMLARLLNARGTLDWDVPVVGHPAISTGSVAPLLSRPQNWDKVYTAGYTSMTYGPDGKLPAGTQQFLDRVKPIFGGKIDFSLWWVALGYDCVELVKHATEKADGTDPVRIQKALESTTDFPGILARYTWGPDQRDGFPDSGMAANTANSFRDGCYAAAPR